MTDPRHPPDDPERPEPGNIPERIERGVGGTVERVGEAVERVEQTVERAAEEVAEEVAEHVPAAMRASVRWTVKRLVLVIGLIVTGVLVVGAVATGYYVWNHTEWAAHELTGRVNGLLTSRSDVELTVGGVRGNPLSAVEVVEPRIRFRGVDGPPLLEARVMRLRYSTWDLMSARRGAVVIEIDRPVIRLPRGADGRMRLPIWKSGPAARGGGRGFDLVLRIRDGALHPPDRELAIEGLDLEADVATGAATRVEVRSLRWTRGPHGLALHGLRGTVAVDDSVRIDIPELRASEFRLRGAARWARSGTTRQVTARVEDLRWRWLARVFRNRTFDIPGQGDFDVSATGDRIWAGALRTRAEWDSLPLAAQGRFGWHEGRFTLTELAGRSPAGNLEDGRVSWSKQGWDIQARASAADPAQWTAIGVRGWPAGALRGRFRYAVDTRGRPQSRLDAELGASAWTGWNVDSAVVTVVWPALAADSFRVVGRRRGGTFDLTGRIDAQGWSGPFTVAGFPLDEWPDGRATGLEGVLGSGAGRIDVRGGELRVTGDLQGTGATWFGAAAARWRMNEVRGRMLPTPDLEAQVRLEDLVYLGIHFDSAAAPIRLGDRTLVFPGLAAHAGDTLVTLSAGASWDAGGWRLVGTAAQARSPQFDWVAEAPLELSGNPRGVTFERLLAADGPARMRIEGRWAVPGGSYDWRARADRLDLGRLGLPAELGLAGEADVDLAVTGVAGDPRWRLHARARRPGIEGQVADSLRLDLGGAPARLDVHDAGLWVNGGRLEADGEVVGMERPWPDTLTADGVVRWLAGASRWSGRAAAYDLPLAQVARMAGAGPGWSGRLEAALTLGGRPADPQAVLVAQASPAGWRNMRVDELAARAEYRNRRLEVTQLRATRDLSVSDVRGEIGVDLRLGRKVEYLDAPMRWRVELPNGDLGLVPLVIPQIGAATGRFEVEGEVRGTPRRPELEGHARIREGRLRLAGRGESLEDVRADFTFGAASVTLDSLRAVQRTAIRTREPGQLTGRGRITLAAGADPQYAFDLQMRDFTASEEGLYAARFDGDFHIVNGARVGGAVLPHVTSDGVEVREAVILYDFARQTEQQQVQASTAPLYWTYRILVRANDKLRWKPPDGDIEFTADLRLEQSVDRLRIYGDMEALRGTYYFLSNRFNVLTARLTFDDVGGVDPVVDATAVTRLTPSRVAGDQTPERTNITVRVAGRSSRPGVSFSSEPVTLDQAQILRELTIGRFVQGQQVALADPLDSYLTRAINRQLSADLSRTFRGYLDEWEVDREGGGVISGQGDLRVKTGSQLSDQLRVSYRQRVPGTESRPAEPGAVLHERDVEAEYRINRFFFITSQLAQRRRGTSGGKGTSSPDFNINLKARWEY